MYTGTFDGSDPFGSTKEIEGYFSAIHANVGFNPFHCDMAGGGNQSVSQSAGIMLSRLYYWGTPNKRGHRRQRIYREGEYWTAMSTADWWEDVRLSRSQVERAKKILAEPFEASKGRFKGYKRGPLIELRNWKFAKRGKHAGQVTHYRILWDNYHSALREISRFVAQIIEEIDKEAMAEEVTGTADLHNSDFQKTSKSDSQETSKSMDSQETSRSLTLDSSLDSKTLSSTTTTGSSENGKIDSELLSLLLGWRIWESRAPKYAEQFSEQELRAAHAMAFDDQKAGDNPQALMCAILDRWIKFPADLEADMAKSKESGRDPRRYRSGEFADFWER